MQHYQWHKSPLFYTSSHSPWTLTQRFWLSGTHQQTHREKCEAVGLVLLQFKLSPRLAHATERFVPCIADGIPCSGKNTSGDAALHWGFLRAVYQKQDHQLYHQLEWLLWLWAGEAVAFFQTSRSCIFPTQSSITSLTEATCAVQIKFTKNSKQCEIWLFSFSFQECEEWEWEKREKQRGLG